MPSDDHAKNLGREFTADVYRTVAEEHIGALCGLYGDGRYTLAIYTAGVAVESVFRAYRIRVDPVFSSRHNLYELWRESRFAAIVPSGREKEYGVVLADIASTWSNNHRYRSEVAMRAFLKRHKLDRGIKGDFLKENARRMINASTELVTLGLVKWKN